MITKNYFYLNCYFTNFIKGTKFIHILNFYLSKNSPSLSIYLLENCKNGERITFRQKSLKVRSSFKFSYYREAYFRLALLNGISSSTRIKYCLKIQSDHFFYGRKFLIITEMSIRTLSFL